MADVDRCVLCAEIIPEGRQVCRKCEIIIATQHRATEMILDHERAKSEAIKTAARIFKDFCNSRNSNPATDCIERPLKEMCGTEPYTWEV